MLKTVFEQSLFLLSLDTTTGLYTSYTCTYYSMYVQYCEEKEKEEEEVFPAHPALSKGAFGRDSR